MESSKVVCIVFLFYDYTTIIGKCQPLFRN